MTCITFRACWPHHAIIFHSWIGTCHFVPCCISDSVVHQNGVSEHLSDCLPKVKLNGGQQHICVTIIVMSRSETHFAQIFFHCHVCFVRIWNADAGEVATSALVFIQVLHIVLMYCVNGSCEWWQFTCGVHYILAPPYLCNDLYTLNNFITVAEPTKVGHKGILLCFTGSCV
jgi:hypothetical protein